MFGDNKQARYIAELSTKPEFLFMVGRLVEAVNLMSLYMALHGDEKARGIAERAYATTDFFKQSGDRTELPEKPQEDDETKVGGWT